MSSTEGWGTSSEAVAEQLLATLDAVISGGPSACADLDALWLLDSETALHARSAVSITLADGSTFVLAVIAQR